MKISIRFAVSLAALAALVIGPTTSGLARTQQPGVYLTSNGYRVPVYGSYISQQPDGRFVATCDQLTQEQIDSSRFGRTVSRKLSERYPRSTVQADEPVSAARFEVLYTDAEGTGFNDPREGPPRKRALEAALRAWSKVLQGTIPIVIEADMPKPEEDQGDLLAQAGPTGMVVLNNLALPTSLASQIVNVVARDVIGEVSDLQVTFNPDASWDYAVDGRPASNRSSFVSTTIHEVAHGLGFIHSYVGDTGELTNPGIPFIYDSFLNRSAGGPNKLTGRSADQIKGDLISRDLFFNGPKAIAASLSAIQPLPMPKLHAPNPFESGSSVAHFDEEHYSEPSLDLMTPSAFQGTGNDKIDVLTLGVMGDMGYKLVPQPATATRRR